MNSAPAVIRTPATFAPALMASPDIDQHEAYPWAAHTPEASPMCWEKTPCVATDCSAAPYSLHGSVLKAACDPYIEQMCRSLGANALVQQLAAEGNVPFELVHSMCAPFFEQMLTSIQESLRHQEHTPEDARSGCCSCQPDTPTSLYWCEDGSTEAEGDTFAFGSLFSSTSSDSDSLDVAERKSVASEAIGDDKSPMVCRHWKSKGWCRLGVDCKFLHPEHKRGITAPTETEILSASQVRRRKRGGKNRSTKTHFAPFCDDGQTVVSAQ